jgi:hypothetical protein
MADGNDGQAKATAETPHILGPVLFVAGFPLVKVIVPAGSSWLSVALYILFAVLGAAILGAGQRRAVVLANRVIAWLLSPVFHLMVFAVMLWPAWVVALASKLLTDVAPRWGQGIVLGLAAALMFWCLSYIHVPGSRHRFLTFLSQKGVFVPLIVAANFLLACVAVFSSLVLVFPSSHTFFAETTQPTHGRLANFFLWHFLDMIPVIEANETINWNAPLTYTHKGVGFILLLFKVAVAWPVIWMIGAAYERMKEVTDRARPLPENERT